MLSFVSGLTITGLFKFAKPEAQYAAFPGVLKMFSPSAISLLSPARVTQSEDHSAARLHADRHVQNGR